MARADWCKVHKKRLSGDRPGQGPYSCPECDTQNAPSAPRNITLAELKENLRLSVDPERGQYGDDDSATISLMWGDKEIDSIRIRFPGTGSDYYG